MLTVLLESGRFFLKRCWEYRLSSGSLPLVCNKLRNEIPPPSSDEITPLFKLGIDRFCEDIKAMTGFYPGIYWRVCWKFVAPIFLVVFTFAFAQHSVRSPSCTKQGITAYGMWDYAPLEYEGYVYPMWANVLGWCIAGSSIAMIPAVAIYKIATTPGSFCEVHEQQHS